MDGIVDSGPVAGANINTGGLTGLGGVGPIKPPTVNTGDPTESFRPTFEDSDIGDIGEPPDPENIRDPDPTGGDPFKPTEILRPPSFRRKVEPKYPSEAKPRRERGQSCSDSYHWRGWQGLQTLRSKRTRLDLAAPEPPCRL